MPRQQRTTGRKPINTSLAITASLALHGVAGLIIWNLVPPVTAPVETLPVVLVELVEPPPPPPPPEPKPDPAPTGPASEIPTPPQPERTAEAAKAPTVTPKPQTAPPPRVHRTPPPTMPTEVVQVADAPATPGFRLLGQGEMAGALTAGAGAGGGSGAGGSGGGGSGGTGTGTGCDMAGRLQAMVRRDARVQATVRQAQAQMQAAGRAMVIWDGDWVHALDQDGRGLAGVRQAIAVEVAFAPRECRMERVRGMVVLSLGDDAASPRLALGAPDWRWGELALR